MKNQGEKVKITLHSTIEDSGEKETNKFEQTGRLFHRGHLDVLIYNEKDESGGKIKNLVTIQPALVNIKRSGSITMNQRFIKDQKTESTYKHPYGEFYLETETHAMDYKPLVEADAGRLTLHYTVWINGTMKRDHLLQLLYKKEVH